MGRPIKEADKKIRKIDVRFTEAEFAAILLLEETLGITRTDLIRQRLLENSPTVVVNAKQLIDLLNVIGGELGRVGNNINQLAKYANILNKENLLSPVVIERFNILFEHFIRNQRSLNTGLRKMIRMMAR